METYHNVPSNRLKKFTVLAILLLILVAGSFLRFYNLGEESLWSDEIGSWQQSNQEELTSVITNLSERDVHPPGFQILLYYVEKYVGDSEAQLRFPSAVAGVLAILAIFLLGRRLYSSKEGLMAAAFMAVLYVPVYFSQEARASSFVILFATLSMNFWVGLLNTLNRGEKPSLGDTAGYILSAAAGSYFNYFGLYLTVLQGIALFLFFLRRRRELIRAIMIYAVLVLAYLPWIPSMWTAFFVKGSLWKFPMLEKPFYVFLNYIFNRSLPLMAVALLLILFMGGVNVYAWFKKGEKPGWRTVLLYPGVLLFLWFFVPILGVYIKSLVSFSVVKAPRHLIISLPPVYLLLARAVATLPLHRALRYAVAVALTAAFALHLIFGLDYYTTPEKMQIREAAAYVMKQDAFYEDSIIIGNFNRFDYYFEKNGFPKRVMFMTGLRGYGLNGPRLEEQIKRANPRYIWSMFLLNKGTNQNSDAKEFLDKNLTTLGTTRFINAEVTLYKNNWYEPGRKGERFIPKPYDGAGGKNFRGKTGGGYQGGGQMGVPPAGTGPGSGSRQGSF